MKVRDLLKPSSYFSIPDFIDPYLKINGISYDSRTVKKGYIFVAIKGEKTDGHLYIDDAIRRGAVVIVAENRLPYTGDKAYPVVYVKNSRDALARISSNFYGHPSKELFLIGVTGTNGKTTTTYLLKSILDMAGIKTGLIGTINYIIGDEIIESAHTTPESPDLQFMLRKMIDSSLSHVVMEVSSHALQLRRVEYTLFKRAIFTNLTRDHLDFHKNMSMYFRAKKRLFNTLLSPDGLSIINIDDEYGRKLFSALNKGITYGIMSGECRALNIENSIKGLVFDLSYRNFKFRIHSSLVGLVNVYNILAAALTSLSMDISPEVIQEGIRNLDSVKGRFQIVDEGQDFFCVVDYAHTDDALKRLILTGREILHMSNGRSGRNDRARIITIFGCGGDRDRSKRPLMGEIATKLSDYVIITNDNPRSEDPLKIINDILSGITGDNYKVIPDRKEAIRFAVEMAQSGDMVIVAGKGHEEYQEINGKRYHFSDEEYLRRYIRERLFSGEIKR